MNKLSLAGLACTVLVSFAGISAIAGPPQTIGCGGTASFGVLDCNLNAHLDCDSDGATLTYSQVQYGQPSCMYYTYNNGLGPQEIAWGEAVHLDLNTQYSAKLNRTEDFEGIGSVLNINTNYYSPGPGPQPIPSQPSAPDCSAKVVASSTNPTVGLVQVACSVSGSNDPNLSVATSVDAYDSNGNRLCSNSQFAALEDEGTACSFARTNPYHEMRYTVNVYDLAGNRLATEDGVLYKMATFNDSPEGHFTNNSLTLTPQAQAKKNPFSHGLYWDFTVTAQVSDQDVDPSENQQLIRVELVDVTTGKVLEDRMANSGEQLTFNLEHQFFTSSGKDSTEGLQRGDNVLKLKVYDAYRPDSESTVVWPAQQLHVEINQ